MLEVAGLQHYLKVICRITFFTKGHNCPLYYIKCTLSNLHSVTSNNKTVSVVALVAKKNSSMCVSHMRKVQERLIWTNVSKQTGNTAIETH